MTSMSLEDVTVIAIHYKPLHIANKPPYIS